MKRAFLLLLAGCLIAGCQDAVPVAATPMQTIENVPLAPQALDPPPLITAEPEPIPKADRAARKDEEIPVPSQEGRVDLPFTPAIAMDPVDGSKVSIRKATPIVEHNKKLYYFGSEANKKVFVANPENYLKGAWTRY